MTLLPSTFHTLSSQGFFIVTLNEVIFFYITVCDHEKLGIGPDLASL